MKKSKQFTVTALVAGTLLLLATEANAQWDLSGNALTGSAPGSVNERFGSTNQFDVIFQTNSIERMRLSSAGNLGIGVVGAAARLHVFGDFLLQDGGQFFRFIPGTTSHQITSSVDLLISSSAAVNTTFATASTYKISSGTSGNVLTTVLGNGFMGIGTINPTAKFQVFGGQMSQVQSGTFGLFATGNEWMGFGLAGSASFPITSVYGMAISRGGFAGYHNLVDNGSTKDLIIGYGNEGAALDANQRMRIRSIRTNGANAPANKDLMVFNSAGFVGVNADPGTVAFLVDATATAIPATNAFRAVTVLSNGSFSTPANVLAATFSSIGQEGNSTITPGTDITGLRAQNGNAGLNCQVNANAAEITWQDLNYAGTVQAATTAQDRLTFNFRNNVSANATANKKQVMTILATGRVGINTNTPVASGTFNVAPSPGGTLNFFLDVNGGIRGQGFFAFSDQRFKTNIETITNPMERIMKMRGTTYLFNAPDAPEGTAGVPQMGFIAQELEKVVPEAVAIGDDGIYAVNYGALTPILVEGIKVQQQQIETQQQQIEAQQAEIVALRTEVAAMKGSTTNNRDGVQTPLEVNPSLGVLQQNVPNPFNQQTVINFTVAENAGVATMAIYDLNGRQIRAEQLNQRGKGQYVINANELAPGMYIYTLIVDGKAADSKRMIVTE
jgi:Chaperone of endosialidase/Secretion system C-terminal sorting domain